VYVQCISDDAAFHRVHDSHAAPHSSTRPLAASDRAGVRTLVCVKADEVEANFSAEIDANMFKHMNENLLQRRYIDDQAKAKTHNQKPYWTYEHSHTIDK
jgi:hypothetical protein